MTVSLAFLDAGGVTGAEIRTHDWSGTTFGPPETWPASLRNTLALMLACPRPMFLAWGPDLLCFYNDSYRPILGYRLSHALGRPFREVWGSIWDDIGPLVEATLAGEPRTLTDMKLDLARAGRAEESWWSFTYSPVYDDAGAINGLLCVTAETTDRVLGEAALRESEDHYRHAVELNPQVPWTCDAAGNITSYATRWLTLTGQAPGEPLGDGWTRAVHPEDLPRTIAVFGACIASGDPVDVDYRIRLASGEHRWMRARAFPRRTEGGEILCWYGVVEDIHDRKQAETRLRRREEQLRLATEAAEIGTWDLDPVGGTLVWSDRTKAMFGFPSGASVTLDDFYATLHPEDLAATRAAFASAIDPALRTTYDAEYRTIGRDDRLVRWVAAKGRGVFDETGRCVRALGTAIDITARKSAEGHLRFQIALADRLRTAARPLDIKMMASASLGAHLGVGRVGYGHLQNEGEVISVERDWCDGRMPSLAGVVRVLDAFGPALVVELRQGQTLVVTDCRTDPRTAEPAFQATWDSIGTRALIVAPMMRSLESGGLSLGGVFFVHSDAPRIWTDAEVGLTMEVAARTWSAYAQAEAEAALRELNATLEERVAGRTAELEQTHEALRQAQKMEAVGQLTGGVAHDFNNLLTIIRSSVDFLRRPDLPEVRKSRYLDAVSETVDRAAKLTGQLLAFARRQALKPEVFDVRARLIVIADLLETVTGACIQVVTALPEETCHIRADLSQFETALINMAVNARDAMEERGTLTIRLECRAPMSPLRDQGGQADRFAAISLSDTGIGIPADHLDRIFEPFFTTKGVGKGTGLGLSQVFGFAKQSGGDIAVISTVGAGTTFTLYLPEIEPDQVPPTAAGVIEHPTVSGDGLRVLLVEDNLEVGRIARQILEDFGYLPTWHTDAESALADVERETTPFDIVVSDVVMPGMGGVALAQELRRRRPDLPVLLASGYSHILAQEDAHGFELLQKPYSAEQLGRTINRIVARQVALSEP
ncbi:PAS domain-containing protein [Methylobacterium sp. 37f]|uniref:PAS domain-containing protein n=1 Tax=Methylobacterium sp. 37f TaxID=2817058 RepID=UPI001FFC90E3|nr:PAS domain-containing protein [Methylobacterium sp. 37f]